MADKKVDIYVAILLLLLNITAINPDVVKADSIICMILSALLRFQRMSAHFSYVLCDHTTLA